MTNAMTGLGQNPGDQLTHRRLVIDNKNPLSLRIVTEVRNRGHNHKIGTNQAKVEWPNVPTDRRARRAREPLAGEEQLP